MQNLNLQQVDFSATVHGSFDSFDFVVDTLHKPVAQIAGYRIFYSIVINQQLRSERHDKFYAVR